jgi:Uma2 family endonuclease
MAIVIQPPISSDDDLMRIGNDNPGYRVEREEDGTITMSPTHTATGPKSLEAAAQLWLYAKQVGGKAYDSSTGFGVGPGKKVRSPDASWNSQETIDALAETAKVGFWSMSPDVCIEVKSDTDTFSETVARIEMYIERGTKYGVAIDPETRQVERRGTPPPGLVLDVDAIIDA